MDLRSLSEGHKYARVVVIAPSHYVGFGFTSIYGGDAYATPLGLVPVDKEFAHRLAKMSPDDAALRQRAPIDPQTPWSTPSRSELPWLQKVLGNFELVPIVMGDQSYASRPRAGRGPGAE